MSTLAHRDGVRRQGEMWPSEGRLCTKVIFFRLVLPIFVMSMMSRLMTYAYFAPCPGVLLLYLNVPCFDPSLYYFECIS